jgi:hypothetical protein
MKFIGILLIINSIAASAWWITTHGTYKVAVISLCSLAVLAGIAFLVCDRLTEFSLEGVGTIRAAAKQATTDANEVAKLKTRVERQSATVDLVAKEAADAKQLVDDLSEKNSKAEEKLSQLDISINEGKIAVKELQLYTQFNTTVLAAQNNNRPAYDQLLTWAKDSLFPFQNASAQAVQTIMDQHASSMYSTGFSIPWTEGVDPQKLSLSELRKNYTSAPPHIRLGLIEFVWSKRTDIPKADRLQFLVDVLRNDENLQVVEYAGRYFAAGTGDKFKPIAIEQHLKWWKENKDSIE